MSEDADILDQASKLTQTLTNAYISNVQDAALPEQKQNGDGSWPHAQCVDCDIDIPQGRLRLGKIRCIECQKDLENERHARSRS